MRDPGVQVSSLYCALGARIPITLTNSPFIRQKCNSDANFLWKKKIPCPSFLSWKRFLFPFENPFYYLSFSPSPRVLSGSNQF